MKKYYIVILLFVLPICLMAQETIITSGNWENTASWASGTIPSTSTSTVTMNTGKSITVNAGSDVSGTITASGINNTIAVVPGGVLTVGDMSNPANLVAGSGMTISVQDGGTIVIWGDLMVTNSLIIVIQGPTGQIIIKGNVSLANNATLSVSGNLEVDGNFTGGTNTDVTVQSGGSVSVGGTLTVGAGSFFHANCDSGTAPTGTNCGAMYAHHCGPDANSQAFCASGGLPVEVVYFKAQANLSSISLKWATASELNFDYFVVEKSLDGKNYNELAKIAGSGTSTKQLEYIADDENPTTGKTYYRLTEVDLDQSVHHLNIIAVDFTSAKSLNIYPNPVTNNQVNFQLNFVPEKAVIVSVVDLRGVTISSFEIKDQSVALPVQLTSGIYVVTMRSQGFNSVSKLVVK